MVPPQKLLKPACPGSQNLLKKGQEDQGGHAVTLIGIDECGALKFINSWGADWGDKGFFRLKDGKVLNMTFYDVYFEVGNIHHD